MAALAVWHEMANSIDGATDGAIQDILCPHTQNYMPGSGAFWDFRPPHFEGVWRVPIYIGPRNGMSERAVVRY